MKPGTKRRFAFIGRSLLWSLLLYAVMMLVFNWDEVNNTVNGRNSITVVTRTLPESQPPYTNDPVISPASISTHTGIVIKVISLLQSIYNIAGNR